jgi:hypothetical protein
MKAAKSSFLLVVMVFFVTSPSMALPTLYDWAFNVDGIVYEKFNGDSMPASSGLLDSNTGIGTITWNVDTMGPHSFTAFFDFEFTDGFNPYFNEYGEAVGTPSVGQNWEIDEPGYLFGDIYYNLLDDTLDNSNAVPLGLEDDVSFALGWDFILGDGEEAIVTLMLSQVMPDGFYLAHNDLDSGESVYLSSTLEQFSPGNETPNAPVPEPATIVLFSTSLAVLCGVKRKKWIARR